MKSFLVPFWALALLQAAKSLPCTGNNCGTLSQLYSEYDDDDGVFYIREGSHNSASSNNYAKMEETSFLNIDGNLNDEQQQQEQQRQPSHQKLSKNYHQSLGPNTPGLGSYQANEQTYDHQNQETQYRPNPVRKNQGNYKSGRNQWVKGGQYPNNDAGSNGYYPGSANQEEGWENYQNINDGYNGQYHGSGNQGGGDGSYHHNQGDSYERYPDSCPNCYATGFGNGDYNKNTINIEK